MLINMKMMIIIIIIIIIIIFSHVLSIDYTFFDQQNFTVIA